MAVYLKPAHESINHSGTGSASHSGTQNPKQSPLHAAYPRKLVSLWYAVYFPQLTDTNKLQSDLENKMRLRQLAELIGELSARISLAPPDGIVFEVRSSLRYFGGIRNIRSQLQQLLEQQLQSWGLDSHFFHSAAPTAASSLLLARSGANLLIYRPASLRSALGRLPVDLLPISAKGKNQLRQTGLLYLRDLWRLPGGSLRQRFGNQLVDYLDTCLGKKVEPLSVHEPLPVFSSRHELEYPVEYTARLLPPVQELLAQLGDYLRQRELCTAHLLLHLEHEAQACSLIEMSLRRPERCESHMLMLLENRIGSLILNAPVTAVTLEAKYFEAFIACSEDLLARQSDNPVNTRSSLSDLLELLQARLGNSAVQVLQAFAEHCPEHASAKINHGEILQKKIHKDTERLLEVIGNFRPRPCWLFDEPESLLEKDGQIYLQTSHTRTMLRIVSEAEQIETRWWAGSDVRRDYYVAVDNIGRTYWVFYSLSHTRGWYLHGIF